MANARKGWRTRRANQARRSSAAKKGWRTRKRNEARRRKFGFEVVLGYSSRSSDNSFRIVIDIRPRKNLSDRDIFTLCTRLIREGFFDDSDELDTSELTWTVPHINYEEILRRDVRMKRGTAFLVEFSREDP